MNFVVDRCWPLFLDVFGTGQWTWSELRSCRRNNRWLLLRWAWMMLYGSQMASHMNINKQSWNVMKLKGNWSILTHKHIARWLKHGAPNQRHETALLICSQAFVRKKTRYCRDIIQQCCSPTCNKTIFCMVLVWHLSASTGHRKTVPSGMCPIHEGKSTRSTVIAIY